MARLKEKIAYALVDLLGGDGQQLAHTMVYDRLFQ